MRYRALLLLAFTTVLGCRKDQSVGFTEQVQPILDKHCIRCHSAVSPSGRIELTSYAKLMDTRAKVSGNQPLIVPGSPTESRLYVLCATTQAHFRMPPDTSGITPLSTDELKILMRWITQGAKEK